MEVNVGLDAAGLPYDAEIGVAAEAARLGYGRVWTGSIGDPFGVCALRWAGTRAEVPGGIGTAIGVAPVGVRTPADLAASAAALSKLTGGRFILGVGAGTTYLSSYRRTWGITEHSPLALMRAYLTTLRGFLAGQAVTYQGGGISYEGARVAAEPTGTPLYLGAANPRMAELGGELADGVYLSWCTPGSVTWIRERIAEGAARAGRDAGQVSLAASVRVCVDDDEDAARQALAAALFPYVAGWDGTPPRAFRAGFERMGFGGEIAKVDRMRERGAGREQIIAEFPERMLRDLGYFGPAAGAAEAVRRQVAGADLAVVRLVPARPGTEAFRAILDACRPGLAASTAAPAL